MEELRERLEQGDLTMWDITNAKNKGKISFEEAEILACILLDC